MKKALKILFFVLLSIMIIIGGVSLYCVILTKDAKLDESKLINMENTVTYYDAYGKIISEESNKNVVTDLKNIPSYVKNAFVAIEDKRFYEHNGIDKKAMARAFINNLKSFSFKEGASTITQQLIKNTHLTNEKTLKRKLIESKLAKQLEKKYDKDQILEMYLNTIYFGNNCFGITKAADFYFSKTPQKLSVSESAVLAGLIKAPSTYAPTANPEKCTARRNVVLSEMRNQGYINNDDYETAKNQSVTVVKNENKFYDYMYLVRKESDAFIEQNKNFSNKYKIYTYFDKDLQKNIEECSDFNGKNSDSSIIVLDNNNHIKAYCSTCGELRRQAGSLIKPLLVYAPAIDCGAAYECTKILDEYTDFGGYKPKNYNDNYNGYITVKDALKQSKNVPAVKILDTVTIKKAKEYLAKTDIQLTENDNGLNMALGVSEKGATLKELTAAYNIFTDNGNYLSPKCISQITDKYGNVLKSNAEKPHKVIGQDTAFIMNDMLNEVAEDGTAKKLKFSNVKLCAKTGTVGNENGNTDAYTVSYNPEYCVGVWLGNENSAYMPNNITGGGLPASLSAEIWKNIYNKTSEPQWFTAPDSVCKAKIDRIGLDDNTVELADENAPERYVSEYYFKKSDLPKSVSKRFSSPKIENKNLSINNNGILIELCLTEYYKARIYKENNGKKTLLFDTAEKGNEYLDQNVLCGKKYTYYAIPYVYQNDNICGDEITLGTIKVPEKNSGTDWWLSPD